MNIVQVTSGETRIPVEEGGGVEQYILNTSKSLSAVGHSITILDRKYSPADPDVEYVEGIRVVRLKAKRFTIPRFVKLSFPINFINLVLNETSFSRQVKKYLAKADVDIIHVHSSIMTIFLAIMTPNIRSRLIYTCHATRGEKASPTLLDRMAIALEGKAVKYSARAIVSNDDMREKLINAAKVKPEYVVTIHLGVDTNRFNPGLDVGDVRQRYGLEGNFVVLFVGVISQRKGIDYLTKAANIVVNEFGYKQVQFVLAGPIAGFGRLERVHSPYSDKIRQLIEDYGLQGKVKLTGAVPVDDLRKLYGACDIFVLPSLAETMATAPLEAMASGKPVIATRVYGMPIQVKEGQSGFLIALADERQLADRIKYFIDNPAEREQMGAYGRRLAEEEFDWSKIPERLLQVYQVAGR